MALAVCCALALAGAVAVVRYFNLNTSYDIKHLQPVAYLQPNPGGAPRVIDVAVDWDGDGYCSGRFTPVIEEHEDKIVVVRVESREPRGHGGGCAGIGSSGTAWGSVELTKPLDSRPIFRQSDGARLPDGAR